MTNSKPKKDYCADCQGELLFFFVSSGDYVHKIRTSEKIDEYKTVCCKCWDKWLCTFDKGYEAAPFCYCPKAS